VTAKAKPAKRIPARKRKASVVERVGLDLNAYVQAHVLPGAAELCEQGKLREIAAERDVRQGERNTVWFIEVTKGRFETTTKLPHNMPPLCWEGRATEAPWLYCLALERYRVARGPASRKMARETVFMQAGSGVQG